MTTPDTVQKPSYVLLLHHMLTFVTTLDSWHRYVPCQTSSPAGRCLLTHRHRGHSGLDGGYVRYCEHTPDRNALKEGGFPWAHSLTSFSSYPQLHWCGMAGTACEVGGYSPHSRQEGEREQKDVPPVAYFLQLGPDP